MKNSVVVLALLALSACQTPDALPITAKPLTTKPITTKDAARPPAVINYVAMGSSYAAGAGIGPRKADSPERCGRTVNNYATLLAERANFNLNDQGCGGATTRHLLNDWNELPAQISAITPETDIVTITIGGNDLDYMGLLFSASCDLEVGMVRDGKPLDCPPRVHLPDEAKYAQVEQNLIEAVQHITDITPDAAIILVQYVSLVPETLCAATPIDRTAQIEARTLAQRLATVTERAATISGAFILRIDEFSATHTACDKEPWSRGFDGLNTPENAPKNAPALGAPWHPTALGHQKIADLLYSLLVNAEPIPEDAI